ncbi:MAG: SAM-dependent chlorinase/fluorinase [Gemmatimonadetes bacterium]|nr:SAM-dependent chlorinase/fluorinase [Gemmatimonadota bacterium]
MTRITLLTDFGAADGYVAAMKGVIASLAPDALIDDAAHDIPPGDVHAAAWALAAYWRLYPPGTIHLAVVDPGVGSERRALAAAVEGRFLVAPDNGVLSRVLDEAAPERVVALTNPVFYRDSVSQTFHGRDIFAPVAAHIARGTPLSELGPPVSDPVRLELPRARRTESGASGVVVHIDRFGNLITNIPGEWAAHARSIEVAGQNVGPLRQAYAQARSGELLAIIGSAGLVEISVRDGSAAAVLAAGRGTPVVIE